VSNSETGDGVVHRTLGTGPAWALLSDINLSSHHLRTPVINTLRGTPVINTLKYTNSGLHTLRGTPTAGYTP